MHYEAREFVRSVAMLVPAIPSYDALDVGGRDVNGSCRNMFMGAIWDVLDIEPGPGVNIVADATLWVPPRTWNLVLCTEVLEHTPLWWMVVDTLWAAAERHVVITCAGPGRVPHSGVDGGYLRVSSGEHYSNIDPAMLMARLCHVGWSRRVIADGADVYAHAWRV